MELQFYSNNMGEYNTIFDLLPFSVYWKDTEGRYVGRNRFAAEQMVSRYKSELFFWILRIKRDR